jgi:hypothetical protein
MSIIIDSAICILIEELIKHSPFFRDSKGIEQYAKIKKTFSDNLEKYLMKTYNRNLYMNTLIFKNRSIEISQLYTPQTIIKKNKSNSYTLFKDKYLFDSIDSHLLKHHNKILISDYAGMGKSTILKWLCIKLIMSSQSIPFLIELRKLNKDNSLKDEILSQFICTEHKIEWIILKQIFEKGGFTFLFDGLDEVSYENVSQVVNDIKDLVASISDNTFILTSRPDNSLSAFGEFQLYEILPFTKTESLEVIEKYGKCNENKLVEELSYEIENKYSQVEIFLKNPLLISLLYSTYCFTLNIANKKSIFYDEVFEALYKKHDLTKSFFIRSIKTDLDYLDFRRIVRELATITYKKHKVEYTEEELRVFIREAINNLIGINIKEDDLITDLLLNVPLFVKEGNIIRWFHKTFQEYFTAGYISSSPIKEEIMGKIIRSVKTNYINVLDFIYDIDYDLFTSCITKELLNDFIDYYNNAYSDFDIKLRSLALRKSLCYGFKLTFIASNKQDYSYPYLIDENQHDSAIVLYYPITSRFRLKMQVSYYQRIIDLLSIKGEKFFINIPEFLTQLDDLYDKTSNQPLPSEIGEIPIDDNLESKINQAHNFDKITFFLFEKSYNINNFSLLDNDLCIKFIDELKEKQKNRKELINDF